MLTRETADVSSLIGDWGFIKINFKLEHYRGIFFEINVNGHACDAHIRFCDKNRAERSFDLFSKFHILHNSVVLHFSFSLSLFLFRRSLFSSFLFLLRISSRRSGKV